MKIAILETIVQPIGHEVELDKILVDNFKKQNHEPVFFVPKNYPFKMDYKAPVTYLDGGEAISYAGVGRLKKLWLSLKREKRRIAWYDSAYEKAKNGECDAILLPTNSWRVLRNLKKSKLRFSPVPVLFILHGVTPKDRKVIMDLVHALKQYSNIHVAVLGMEDNFIEVADCPNFHTILPTVYKPMYLNKEPEFTIHNPLKLGFLGQYRKEKNVDFFLDAFKMINFKCPVELLVQGATVTPVDSEDFERLMKKYENVKNLSFLHKSLIGKEWEEELSKCDVILMPYGAERYRYQPSAMLFVGIGYYKPVLQSPEMSPEVIDEFNIGEKVQVKNLTTFAKQLENFVNNFEKNAAEYKRNLKTANEKFSQENLVKHIVEIFSK